MRRGWLIAAISSVVLLVPAERSTGQETDDNQVVSKKGCPAACEETTHFTTSVRWRNWRMRLRQVSLKFAPTPVSKSLFNTSVNCQT